MEKMYEYLYISPDEVNEEKVKQVSLLCASLSL